MMFGDVEQAKVMTDYMADFFKWKYLPTSLRHLLYECGYNSARSSAAILLWQPNEKETYGFSAQLAETQPNRLCKNTAQYDTLYRLKRNGATDLRYARQCLLKTCIGHA